MPSKSIQHNPAGSGYCRFYAVLCDRIKPAVSALFFVLWSVALTAQSDLYIQKVKKGETHIASGEYQKAAKCYSEAFESFGWRGFLPDRLNAARAWAMAGVPDSAYFNLMRIAERIDYGNLEELTTDFYFQSLKSDPRWPILYNLVEKNSHSYGNRVKMAEKQFKAIQYAEAAKSYSEAFQAAGGMGSIVDRLNAGRSWALAGVPDSAFSQLFIIAALGGNDNAEAADAYQRFLDALDSDQYLQSIRADDRWLPLYKLAKSKGPSMPELARTLENVIRQDQVYRAMIDSIETKFGRNSAEMTNLWKLMDHQDSVDQLIVIEVLEKYGWLGKSAVGFAGNSAIFLVVQHAPLPVQEKYLPLMREAVKAGNAEGSALALLEDRVLMRNGKKQVYGSQVKRDPVTNESYFGAIEDVEHVDERRATVGLGPLADYARHFGIVWNEAAIEKNKNLVPDPPEKK